MLVVPLSSDWYQIFSILVIVGTGIAYFSPLGGFLQILGIVFFTTKLAEWMHILRVHSEGAALPGLGPSIALFGAVIMTASIFRSAGGRSKKTMLLRDRLLAFRMADSPAGLADHEIFHRLKEEWNEYRVALLSGAVAASVYSFFLAGLVPVSSRRWADVYQDLLFLGAAWALLAVPCAASLFGNRRR